MAVIEEILADYEALRPAQEAFYQDLHRHSELSHQEHRTAELARMAALHTDATQVGSVAERAGVHELILSHYLPAEPEAVTETEWAHRAGKGFSGKITAGHDRLGRTLRTAETRT
jgi:ribonuclease BN (tRNA processing enzyme)